MASTGHSKFSQDVDYRITTFEWILQKCDVIFERKDKKIFTSKDFCLTNRRQVKCSIFLCIDALQYESSGNNDPYSKSILIVTINPSKNDIAKLLIKIKINHASDESKSFKIESQIININGARSTDDINLKFPLPGQCSSYDQTTPLISLVSNNKLTIDIEIEEIKESSKSDHKMKLTTEMFATLYKNHELFDVTFLVGENNCGMKAHALVLAAACPYFSAMFNNNMKEKKEHIVDLTKDADINEEILQAFLDCIYGIKSVNEVKNVARDLLVLADKYNMTELLKSCEIMLCQTLDKTNLASLFLFADKYKCELLKKKALYFTKTCMENEEYSEEFKERCKDEEFLKDIFSLIEYFNSS